MKFTLSFVTPPHLTSPSRGEEFGHRLMVACGFLALFLMVLVAGAARAENSPLVLLPLEQSGECGMDVHDASDKKIILAHQSAEDDLNKLQIDVGNGPQWLDQKKSIKIGNDLLEVGQKIRQSYEGGGISVTIKATSVGPCCGMAKKEECECTMLVGSMRVQRNKDHRNYRIEIHEGC